MKCKFSFGLDYVISRLNFGDDDYNLNYWHPLSVDPSICGRLYYLSNWNSQNKYIFSPYPPSAPSFQDVIVV